MRCLPLFVVINCTVAGIDPIFNLFLWVFPQFFNLTRCIALAMRQHVECFVPCELDWNDLVGQIVGRAHHMSEVDVSMSYFSE